ncbi:MAG: alpha/beta fold hydrolase [Kouleothrix sp.]|nr:alpha/beta fold hydrolase [Kouleothrix sp.]
MAWARIQRRGAVALGLALGIAAGRVGYAAAALTRLAITGGRQPLWRTPAQVGLPFEEVVFRSHDGVMLRGWLIHRADHDGSRAPTIVFVHGWPWNRLGNRAGCTLMPDRTVDFLEPARALAQAGFHVLLFDLRNHGESAAAWPVTFGVRESRDLVGAVMMLRKRPEVDGKRIGVIGYSMGANTAIYGIPRCQPIRAAVAVQPTSIGVYAPNLARTMLGPAGPSLAKLAEPLCRAFGAPAFAQIAPARAAPLLGPTKLLYIQGDGDQWGSLADAQAIAAATPSARPLIVAPSTDRFGGYLYVNEHLDEIVSFFEENLKG